MNRSEIGIVGLGVMGRSLAKNVAGKGISISVYNRTTFTEQEVVADFLKANPSELIQGFTQLEEFCESLSTPRKIVLMVSAGSAVDHVINQIKPFLQGKDILIDGGNSHFKDTQRRLLQLKHENIHYLGCGVSGGEQGALHGPSMMVGGSLAVYSQVAEILEQIAAKDTQKMPCVTLVGPNGSGHFVKMVHNGIEYAEMQLLAECYSLLATYYSHNEIAAILKEWNKTALGSYLLEITQQILLKKEGDDFLLNKILDMAGAKGTGSWAAQSALELGVPATMIMSAVTARAISQQKEKRKKWSEEMKASIKQDKIDPNMLRQAYQFARLINHHQGFELIQTASESYNWEINLSELARIWTQGCIIKSKLMEKLVTILKKEESILQHTSVLRDWKKGENALHIILNQAFNLSIAIPCISSSYNYLLSMTTHDSPANLLQAQRDFFGAHGYRRTDHADDTLFSTKWNLDG